MTLVVPYRLHPALRLGNRHRLRDTEELEVLLLVERHGVADALGEDRLELGAERGVVVAAREAGRGRVRDGRARVPEHGRPLLHLLVEVLRRERRVAASKPSKKQKQTNTKNAFSSTQPTTRTRTRTRRSEIA